MWWRNPLVAVAAALTLAACTFTPVYGPDGPGQRLFGQVQPAQPNTQDEFAFTRRLGERLGSEGSRYTLDYQLQIAVVPQAITRDQNTTRYSLNGTAAFTLTDRSTGAVVTRGQVSNFTSYSAVGTTIATLAAETDARNRLAIMLADQVLTRLYATMPADNP